MVTKAVIFDVGGVLVRTESRDKRMKWEKKLGLDVGQSDEIVFDSEMGMKAQLGKISNQELWDWVGSRLNLSDTELEMFHRDFWAGDVLDEELITFIRSLRPKYRTAIISNATKSLRYRLREIYPIEDAFDLIVCSAEEGIMKPNVEIYMRALERLGIQPEQSIFVDDNDSNVEAAGKLGMRTILFRTGMDITTTVREMVA